MYELCCVYTWFELRKDLPRLCAVSPRGLVDAPFIIAARTTGTRGRSNARARHAAGGGAGAAARVAGLPRPACRPADIHLGHSIIHLQVVFILATIQYNYICDNNTN